MTRHRRRPPRTAPKPPQPAVLPRPGKVALHMLNLGYDWHYVALWLWHMTRVEADVDVPESVPEALR